MHIELISKLSDEDEKLKSYTLKKIAKLEKYMGSHARKSAHAEVRLKELKEKKQKCECEVVIHMPKETIVVKEATINMYAAVDIVVEKMKNRLKKYHELHLPKRGRVHGVFKAVKSKLRRQYD